MKIQYIEKMQRDVIKIGVKRTHPIMIG